MRRRAAPLPTPQASSIPRASGLTGLDPVVMAGARPAVHVCCYDAAMPNSIQLLRSEHYLLRRRGDAMWFVHPFGVHALS